MSNGSVVIAVQHAAARGDSPDAMAVILTWYCKLCEAGKRG